MPLKAENTAAAAQRRTVCGVRHTRYTHAAYGTQARPVCLTAANKALRHCRALPFY